MFFEFDKVVRAETVRQTDRKSGRERERLRNYWNMCKIKFIPVEVDESRKTKRDAFYCGKGGEAKKTNGETFCRRPCTFFVRPVANDVITCTSSDASTRRIVTVASLVVRSRAKTLPT